MTGATIPVRDVTAERTFYTQKLRFGSSTDTGLALRVPGNSSNTIELRPVSPTTELEITFLVENAKRTAKSLRQCGLTAHTRNHEVTVSDSDGILIVFRQAVRR